MFNFYKLKFIIQENQYAVNVIKILMKLFQSNPSDHPRLGGASALRDDRDIVQAVRVHIAA